MSALVSAFERESNIKVSVRSDDEATLANQLLQEGSDTPADVFVAENPPALTVLDDAHRLAKTDASTLAKVDAAYNPTSGDWVGVSARSVALAYNTGQVQESALPTKIVDFAQPQWKGKVGFAPTETDFQPVVTAMVKEIGVDATKSWLSGLKSNAKIYDDNEALVAAVDKGEVETGILDHYYWYRLRDEVGANSVHSALHYFGSDDPGSLVDVSGAGQTLSSKHPKSAQAFLAFLVSKRPGSRSSLDSQSYEYPLGSGVQTTKVARKFADLGAPTITIADLGDGKQAIQLLQDAGLLD
jgi:iron(III) transport system substrate-binding protein